MYVIFIPYKCINHNDYDHGTINSIIFGRSKGVRVFSQGSRAVASYLNNNFLDKGIPMSPHGYRALPLTFMAHFKDDPEFECG